MRLRAYRFVMHNVRCSFFVVKMYDAWYAVAYDEKPLHDGHWGITEEPVRRLIEEEHFLSASEMSTAVTVGSGTCAGYDYEMLYAFLDTDTGELTNWKQLSEIVEEEHAERTD